MQGVPLKNTLRNPSGRLEKRECFWKAYGQKKQAGLGRPVCHLSSREI